MAIEVEEAFAALGRLSDAGLIRVGRIEYVDDGPPGRVAPVKHVVEQLDMVKARVRASCLRGKDWEWSCWVVNTTDGDAIARRSLEGGSLRSASEEA